jgi:hypothetical protein
MGTARNISLRSDISPMVTVMPQNVHLLISESGLPGFVLRHRKLVLTSPLWVALILISLKTFGSPDIRQTIEFMTGSSLIGK